MYHESSSETRQTLEILSDGFGNVTVRLHMVVTLLDVCHSEF